MMVAGTVVLALVAAVWLVWAVPGRVTAKEGLEPKDRLTLENEIRKTIASADSIRLSRGAHRCSYALVGSLKKEGLLRPFGEMR